MNHLLQAPENNIRVISNFSRNCCNCIVSCLHGNCGKLSYWLLNSFSSPCFPVTIIFNCRLYPATSNHTTPACFSPCLPWRKSISRFGAKTLGNHSVLPTLVRVFRPKMRQKTVFGYRRRPV